MFILYSSVSFCFSLHPLICFFFSFFHHVIFSQCACFSLSLSSFFHLLIFFSCFPSMFFLFSSVSFCLSLPPLICFHHFSCFYHLFLFDMCFFPLLSVSLRLFIPLLILSVSFFLFPSVLFLSLFILTSSFLVLSLANCFSFSASLSFPGFSLNQKEWRTYSLKMIM